MAETINRKLKAVLAHQVKLNRALLGVIQDEYALSQEKKFVFASPPTMPTRTTLAKGKRRLCVVGVYYNLIADKKKCSDVLVLQNRQQYLSYH
ncbi:hypothetical protein PPTG_03446 [Phytophthora nicotianae INRA-310]|uniref:Uncharacterized protein n=1 Tax=Phytophthora nicotianae (strain INRA-310) TaxID=761204 RepID=W2R6W7_PHYN3|nr:hypothetical protein PPTG_03446 [Phytophthora nicotianae INRA-310]ETN20444.1 hypothetical protein PPTG_03446 [Phytophthora nicotianae INRA-310]